MDIPEQELEDRLVFEEICKTAEEKYIENPTDADNLTRWGEALVELSHCVSINESKNVLKEAVSKLEEALSINPAKHEALWCLGKAHTVNAFLISNHAEAKIMFDEAFHCIQKAADECPENAEYLQYLAECAKLPALHKEIRTRVASSSAKGSAKNKISDLQYDICGWVILAVGIFTWIGMANSWEP